MCGALVRAGCAGFSLATVASCIAIRRAVHRAFVERGGWLPPTVLVLLLAVLRSAALPLSRLTLPAAQPSLQVQQRITAG